MLRLFAIDDDVMVRYALTNLVNQEHDMVMVGDAPPNDHLIQLIEATKPDMLILDIPIPRDKGIKYLKDLHRFHLPAIIFTKSDPNMARDIIPLLKAGSVGFVIKPPDGGSINDVRDQLVYEIHRNSKPDDFIAVHPALHDPLWCVAIGSSTGGPEALMKVIPQFPANFPAAISIVQHMPQKFTTSFSARLNSSSNLIVKEAEEGDVLKSGMAVVAPGDWHMEFTETNHERKQTCRVRLTKDPPQWLLRPTVDHMMTSLAPIYRDHLVGVILTGMGEDGVIGMRAIKQYGGYTLVQNKATSAVFGMGQEVIKNNLADEVLPLEKIAGRIMEIITV